MVGELQLGINPDFVVSDGTVRRQCVYLACSMRGKPLFNFPEFDRYAKHLRGQGFNVISPAELDRAHNFDENHTQEQEITKEMKMQFMLRDVEAIANCDALAVMPEWEDSQGVNVEIKLAAFFDMPVYFLGPI